MSENLLEINNFSIIFYKYQDGPNHEFWYDNINVQIK